MGSVLFCSELDMVNGELLCVYAQEDKDIAVYI